MSRSFILIILPLLFVISSLGFARPKFHQKDTVRDTNMCTIYYNKGRSYDKEHDKIHAIEYYTKAIDCNPFLLDAYFNRGINKRDLKDSKGALSDFNQVISIDSTYSKAYLSRGFLKLNLSDTGSALSDYNKAIRFNPHYSRAYLFRGSLKKILLDFDGAMADYNASISIDSESIDAFYRRGLLYHDLKKYAEAILDFNRCLELDPLSPDAYNARGNAKYRLDDNYGALMDYTQAIKLNPKDNAPYYNRGNAKKYLKDYSGAVDDYTLAISINPKNHVYYYERALVKQELNNFDKSIIDFDQAINLNKTNANYYRYRGYSKYKLKDYDRAIEDFNMAISIDSMKGDFYYFRGLCRYNKDDYREAIEDYNKAEKLYKKGASAHLYINRGNARKEFKQYSEAVTDYSNAIRKDDKYSNAYLYRGQIRVTLGDYEEALSDFKTVINLNPGDAKGYYWMGKTELARGNYVGALPYYDQTIAKEPQNALLFSERGRIKENLNDKEGALKDFSESRRLDSLLFQPKLKNGITEADKFAIVKMSKNCFPIEGSIALLMTTQDLSFRTLGFHDKANTIQNVEELENKFTSDSTNFSLCLSIGIKYKNLGKREEALKYLRKSVQLVEKQIKEDPSDSSAYARLGTSYAHLEQCPEALSAFDKYLEKNPMDEDIRALQVICLISMGDFSKVYEHSKTTISRFPEDPNAYLILSMAIIFDTIANIKDAIADIKNKTIEEVIRFSLLEDACKKYPENIRLKLFYQLSRQYALIIKVGMEGFNCTKYDIEQIKDTKSFFYEILRRKDFDNKYTVYKSLGNLNFISKQFKQAIACYRKAIDLKSPKQTSQLSNSGEIYEQLISTYLLLGDTSEAEKIVKEKIGKRPEIYAQANDYVSLARFYFNKGDLNHAIDACNKAIDIDPLSKNAYIGLSAIHLYNSETIKAKDFCIKASNIGAEDENVLTLSAIIWILEKDYRSAYYCLNKAITIDPDAEVPKKILENYFEK